MQSLATTLTSHDLMPSPLHQVELTQAEKRLQALIIEGLNSGQPQTFKDASHFKEDFLRRAALQASTRLNRKTTS